MTLNTNEIVYTADLMNISPANDAQIYGKDGNYILSGLEIRAVTSTSATLTAGRAIIQGRLFELKANTQYPLKAGTSQYLGLEIDLTKENTDDGMGNITNNQFTVKSNDKEYGDTRLGDVQSFVAFYQVNTQNTTSTKIMYQYNVKYDISSGYGDVGFPANTGEQTPTVTRVGKVVQLTGSLTNIGSVANGRANVIMRVLPIDCRPSAPLYGVFPSTGKTYEIGVYPDGNLTMTNYSGYNFDVGKFIPITFNFIAK